MIATSQVQSCYTPRNGMFANYGHMTGLEEDTDLIQKLVKFTKLAPSRLAKEAGLTATTITRPYSGTATTRISTPTLEKLRDRFPSFDWTRQLPDGLETRDDDGPVAIERLPTFAGMGGGGTGDGDRGTVTFSRSLIEMDLRAKPEDLLAIVAEGNSMEPDLQGGDQILIDKRRRTLSSPGAFCLWDGDGYVIKYLERVPGSDPVRVRVVSKNQELYPPYERLASECDIQGRVIWFGRQIR